MKIASVFSLFLLIPSIVFSQSEECKCCSENHKAFDFWVGEWKVTNPDGSLAGTNTIKKIQDDCILQENWSGTSGNTGASINFYNLRTEQWEQLWIDNSGTHLKLKGHRSGNKMILSSDEFTGDDGKEYVNRVTWSFNEDGTVRQFWEILHDGKTVNVAFDGLYTRVE